MQYNKQRSSLGVYQTQLQVFYSFASSSSAVNTPLITRYQSSSSSDISSMISPSSSSSQVGCIYVAVALVYSRVAISASLSLTSPFYESLSSICESFVSLQGSESNSYIISSYSYSSSSSLAQIPSDLWRSSSIITSSLLAGPRSIAQIYIVPAYPPLPIIGSIVKVALSYPFRPPLLRRLLLHPLFREGFPLVWQFLAIYPALLQLKQSRYSLYFYSLV